MTLVVACRLLVTDGIRFLSKPVSTEQNHSQVLAHSVTSLRLVLLVGGVLLSWLGLVLLVQDFAKALGHQIGSLWTAIVPLKILQETEEKSVHAHGVDTEESMGNEVGAQRHSQDGYPVVVEMGSCILKGLHSPREEKEGKDPYEPNNQKLAQKQKEICHFVQDSHPDHVPH